MVSTAASLKNSGADRFFCKQDFTDTFWMFSVHDIAVNRVFFEKDRKILVNAGPAFHA